MKFKVKRLKMQNKLYSILIPENIPNHIWFSDPVVDSKAIFADAEGFAFLRDLFLIASHYRVQNAILYVPIARKKSADRKGLMPCMTDMENIGEYNLNLILFNYHNTHLDTKLAKVMASSLEYVPAHHLIIDPNRNLLETYREGYEHWKLRKTLTTKVHQHQLYIAADDYMLVHLAYEANMYIDIPNDSESNYIAHTHADHLGTSKDNGINYFYYYPYHSIEKS